MRPNIQDARCLKVKDMDYRLATEGQSILTGVKQIPHRLPKEVTGGSIETWYLSSNMKEPCDYHYQFESQHVVHSLVTINVHSSTKFTTKEIEVETIVSPLLCGMRIRNSGRKEFVSPVTPATQHHNNKKHFANINTRLSSTGSVKLDPRHRISRDMISEISPCTHKYRP